MLSLSEHGFDASLHGARGTARLRLGVSFASAVRTDALEDDVAPLAWDGETIELPHRPHELITVKVT